MQNRNPQQEPEETSLIAELKSQLRSEVATRNSSAQLFPGHDTTKTTLEGEIEGCIKTSRDWNMRLLPEILSHPEIDVATKEVLLKQKEYSRKNLRSRHQLEVATPNEDNAGRNINLRSRR